MEKFIVKKKVSDNDQRVDAAVGNESTIKKKNIFNGYSKYVNFIHEAKQKCKRTNQLTSAGKANCWIYRVCQL